MVRITEELVRKRAEHNNCEITTLEELTLHQSEIERIEHLDKWCRDLKILYLQSNLIQRIENVGRLKKLEYLNLALNNIERIENLEGCESLQKLDLTVNFVGELTSLDSLKRNEELSVLYMIGNPCTDFEGYRKYVVATLPQLKWLDGKEIEKSERILAMQEYDSLRQMIIDQQMEYLEKRAREKQEAETKKERKPGFDGKWYTDINSHLHSEDKTHTEASSEAQEGSTTGDAEDDSFWHEKMAYTPESRIEMHRRLSQERKDVEAPKQSPWQVPKREIRLTTEEGRVLNINQGKWDFALNDDDLGKSLVLDVAVQRYLDTSLIDCDVQPGHIKCLIKGKVLQIVLPEEVNPDLSTAKRSQTTGHLVITMPKAKQMVRPQRSQASRKPKTRPCQDPLANPKLNFFHNQTVSHEKLEVDPSVATHVDLTGIVSERTSSHTAKQEVKKAVQDELIHIEHKSCSELFVDDSEVPPLM